MDSNSRRAGSRASAVATFARRVVALPVIAVRSVAVRSVAVRSVAPRVVAPRVVAARVVAARVIGLLVVGVLVTGVGVRAWRAADPPRAESVAGGGVRPVPTADPAMRRDGSPHGPTADPTTRLQRGLVSAADVAVDGYLPTTPGAKAGGRFEAKTPACRATYELLSGALDPAAVTVDASFGRGGTSSLMQSWTQVPGATGAVEPALDRLRDIARCPDATLVSGAGIPDLALSFSSAPLPALGERSFALRATGAYGNVPIELNVAVVAVGQCVEMVTQGGPSIALDPALVARVARLGVERLPAA